MTDVREVWDRLWREKGSAAAWDAPGDGLDLCLPYLDVLPNDGPLLDLGCGDGRLLVPMAKARPDQEFTGADCSMAALGAVNDRISFSEMPNVTTMLANGEGDLCLHTWFIGGLSGRLQRVEPFAGGWSFLMFQHIEPEVQRRYLAETRRICRKGATFVLQFVAIADRGPLSHPIEVGELHRWAWSTGWDVEELSLPWREQPSWAIATMVAR